MKGFAFKNVVSIFLMFMAAYLIAVLNHSQFWAGIIAPVGTMLCSVIIFQNYLIKSNKRMYVRYAWLLMGLASLAWCMADLSWAVVKLFFKIDADSNSFITLMYLFPNIFLFAACVVFLLYHVRRWNLVQLILDVSAVCASGFLIIWVLVFNSSYELFYIIVKDGVISVASILIDSLIIAGAAVWWLSIRTGKPPVFIKIIFLGLMCFSLNDLYYYYLYFNNAYIPNSIMDVVYILSFMLIGLGAAYEVSFNETNIYADEKIRNNNIGSRHNVVVLLLCPSLIIIAEGISSIHLIRALFIIVIYEVISSQIQEAIKNRNLFQGQRDLNKVLEKRIAERTHEIKKINEKLLAKNKELAFLSNQDLVTRLYNRRYFINMINKKIDKILPQQTIAVLFVDMDRFKTINDTYGHDIGDKVLVELSERFQHLRTDNSIIARLGGDEFVFAYWGNYDYTKANEIGSNIINCCKSELYIDKYRFNVTLSVGISIYPFDADNCSMLMKNADMAMYRAKATGYNKCISFNALLKEEINRKNEIEIMLRKADYEKEFMLYYQPQFSIPDKRLLGIEALLRWNSPEAGLIPPSEFIPIAEELDCILPIGEWVMKEAVRQISDWNRRYCMNLKMGINISPKQLDSKNFINILKKKLQDEFADSSWLDIELTESIAIEDEYRISEISDLFQGVGTSISIDDFGTGYSSLSYLKMFPFDRIKIAKPLIDALSEDDYDMQIVKAIIMLAKSIGIKTIAEGVETQQQMDILTELGCEEIQGFLLGKPMPAEHFEKIFLENIEKVTVAIPQTKDLNVSPGRY